MLLGRDPRLSGLAARPLELRWHRPSGTRAHAPQPMLRPAEGQGVPAHRTGSKELSRRPRSLAAAATEICTAAGWRYWMLGPVDPVHRRNVIWLAGYRHPRHHSGQLPAAALQGPCRCERAYAGPGTRWSCFPRCSLPCGRNGGRRT
ncbi:hypothetical protein [Streptomyces anthocyanicus]